MGRVVKFIFDGRSSWPLAAVKANGWGYLDMSKVRGRGADVKAKATGTVTRAPKPGAGESNLLGAGVTAAEDVVAFDELTQREAALSAKVRELRESRPATDVELVAAREQHADCSLALNLLRKLRTAGATLAECEALGRVFPTLQRG